MDHTLLGHLGLDVDNAHDPTGKKLCTSSSSPRVRRNNVHMSDASHVYSIEIMRLSYMYLYRKKKPPTGLKNLLKWLKQKIC